MIPNSELKLLDRSAPRLLHALCGGFEEKVWLYFRYGRTTTSLRSRHRTTGEIEKWLSSQARRSLNAAWSPPMTIEEGGADAHRLVRKRWRPPRIDQTVGRRSW